MNAANPPHPAKEISCRITRTLLLYVREKNNDSLGNLLDGLPCDEASLMDINNWVPHALLQVLYERMIDLLGDEQAVYHMTLASERLHALGFLERIGLLLGSPRLIYAQAPKYNDFFRLNGSLLIHDIGPSWVVLEDRYHDNHQKTRHDCDYTRGFLTGIPTIFGMPMAEVEEVSCQVRPEKYGERRWPDHPCQGSDGCVYRVRWNPKGTHFLKRFFFKRKTHRQAIEDLVGANQLIQAKYDEVTRLVRDLEHKNQELVASQRELEAQKRALTESERKYRTLAENVSDTIWVVNLETMKIDYVSPSVVKNLKFTPEEIHAMRLEEILSPQSMAKVSALIERAQEDDGNDVDPQQSLTLDVEHAVKGGGYAWSEATVTFLRTPDGRPTAVMGVTRDVSERRKAEKKIAESERKYRNLFENGSDLICIHDLEGNLLETNLGYKTGYGWRQKDLHNVNIRHLIPKRDRSAFDAYLKRIVARGADEGYVTTHTPDGRKITLEYRNTLIRSENGQPVAVQGAARDVTQRLQYERALREREEQYREIVTHAPAAIVEIDAARMTFISVNDVMTTYSGYTKDELLDMELSSLLGTQGKAKVQRRFSNAQNGQEDSSPDEYTLHGKNGKSLPVLANYTFFFSRGVPFKVMTIFHDMTAIKEAEEEKRVLETKLQQAKKYESLGTLAGGVAHDLNNILSSIVGYPDLLLRHVDEDSPLRKPLVAIRKSGEKAAEIVQDLLTLARRNVPAKHVMNVNAVVRDFVDSPEYRRFFGPYKPIGVSLELAEDALNILGSETHVFKTVMNLVANACDAIVDQGNIIIATENRYVDAPYTGFERVPKGEYVVLRVSDTGVGMSQTDLEKIFEPFYTKKVLGRSGTGLGMSVVWGTVKDHEGYFDIFTEEGKGTTFLLFFPATRLEIDAPKIVRFQDYLGRGESILVVDDDADQRDLARNLLEHLRYEVTTAACGEEAVALVKQRSFHLLILDMIMPPGMDGLDTYRTILRIVPNQKALIASGFAETDRVRTTQEIGAGAYIKKPFTLETIGLAIRRELDRRPPDHKDGDAPRGSR